ncbi:hypothetical protein MKZ38_007921 [Zalerion maritima]|uniref:Uncharacterized protein n=1 Tax=Zalerion maritima TaxID=339359 RepID=A0AAD5RLK2_9PEZI|nr:hypothetical protein MKZ38_007921 [Zalerion maritima]
MTPARPNEDSSPYWMVGATKETISHSSEHFHLHHPISCPTLVISPFLLVIIILTKPKLNLILPPLRRLPLQPPLHPEPVLVLPHPPVRFHRRAQYHPGHLDKPMVVKTLGISIKSPYLPQTSLFAVPVQPLPLNHREICLPNRKGRRRKGEKIAVGTPHFTAPTAAPRIPTFPALSTSPDSHLLGDFELEPPSSWDEDGALDLAVDVVEVSAIAAGKIQIGKRSGSTREEQELGTLAQLRLG